MEELPGADRDLKWAASPIQGDEYHHGTDPSSPSATSIQSSATVREMASAEKITSLPHPNEPSATDILPYLKQPFGCLPASFTTISHEAELKQVRQILSTGSPQFHDRFQQRSTPGNLMLSPIEQRAAAGFHTRKPRAVSFDFAPDGLLT